MWSWETISLVAAILASVGALTDRLILNRQKSALQLVLIQSWNRLDDTRIPDIPRLVAGWFLRIVRKAAGSEGLSFRGITIATTGSVAMTSASIIVGAWLSYDLESAIAQLGMLLADVPKLLSLYPANLVFDLATIIVTIAIVRKIYRLGAFRALGWMLLDIVIAGCLAIMCVTVAIGAIDILVLGQAPELTRNFITWWKGMLALFNPIHPNAETTFIVEALYSMTTFLPTTIFVIFLLLSGFAKPIARAGRMFSKHILEIATEGEPENLLVFTMLGSLCGVVSLFAKTIHHFLT